MRLDEYQARASATDQVPQAEGAGVLVPLLGLAGESGSLLVAYKKYLRDGPAHRLFKSEVAEEIGDILWYLSNLATKFDISLDEIAAQNLAKTQARWPSQPDGPALFPRHQFDEAYPETEQLPRSFTAEILETGEGRNRRIELRIDGTKIGNELTDNAYEDDGYRFHDVLHLANIAILGWSPTIRGLMKRKRRSSPEIDRIEDGGRAIVIDEGVVAFIFDYARRHDFLRGVPGVDYNLLKTVRGLTAGLEVSQRSSHEWEQAIIDGYRAWRVVREQGGGTLHIDMLQGTTTVE